MAIPGLGVHSGRYIRLFVLVLVGTVLLFGFLLRQSYTQRIDKAYSDVANLAWVLDSQLETSMRRLDANLQQMAKRATPEQLNPKGAARFRAQWTAYLDDLKIDFPEVTDFYVIDARGDVLYASGAPKSFNVADRSHFKRLSADPLAQLVHTDVVTSRANGRPTMVFARGLRDGSGKFLGLVSVLVDLDHVQKLFQSIDVGKKGIIALRGSGDNKLVVRQPHLPAEVNKASRSANFDRILSGEKLGTSLFTSPLDGTTRYTIFRALERYPFWIYIALAQDEVLAGWWIQLAISLAVSALLLLVIGLALRRLWRTEVQRVAALQAATQARDAAELASKSKGQFLANMSHEIRTPMNAILGLLNLLQTTELTARQRDYASKTEGAAQSLLGLLNDILDFSKVEAGKMTLEHESFSLDRMLRNLAVVLSSNVKIKGVEVLFDIDATLPDVVQGDALRLQQVLINLGGNAVKFTSKGEVVLTLRKLAQTVHSARIEFAVRDTGIGIAPQNQAYIFSGFSQAEGSTTRRFGGTGLGLAISQRLVQLMGGDIQLSSTPGVGSTFSFVLDMPLVSKVSGELAKPQRPAIAPVRVLVVDDNPLAGEITLRMVQSWGWSAALARSGKEALDMIAVQHAQGTNVFPYPLIYMDWHMPEMDGWETTQRIRQFAQQNNLPQPTVVMVTANARESLAQRSQEEQNLLNGFVAKPATASMLLDAYMDATAGASGLRVLAHGRSSQRQLSGMRLLVVEDNLINQQVAEELLSAEGAIVSLAANGHLGVEAVAAAAPQFDAVLMDIQMPVLDGYGATKLIREQLGLKNLPIVAMTANAMPSDRDACLAAGMNEHIGKPFDMAELVSVLIRVTGLVPTGPYTTPTTLPPAPAQGVLAVPGLELSTALARMSGMRSLYARTARDFSKTLGFILGELEHQFNAGHRQAVLMQLHTLKGNAGTLGASALADKAAALEDLCKREGTMPEFLQGLAELGPLLKTTQALLAQALAQLEPQAVPPSTTSVAVAPPGADVVLSALQELAALAAEGDMAVLQRFAELRASVQGLPDGFEDRLDGALQNLDMALAHKVCAEMLGKLAG